MLGTSSRYNSGMSVSPGGLCVINHNSRWFAAEKRSSLVRYAVMSTRTVHGTPLKHTRGLSTLMTVTILLRFRSHSCHRRCRRRFRSVGAYHQRAPLVLPFLCLCNASIKKLGAELWVHIDEQPKASGTAVVVVVSFIRTFIRWTLFRFNRRRVISRTINQSRRAYSEWRLNESNQEQWW